MENLGEIIHAKMKIAVVTIFIVTHGKNITCIDAHNTLAVKL